MDTVQLTMGNVPVLLRTDLCVLGGSCTGVFAAVRAARLGLRVALVEKQNSFGGVATQGLVTIWHSLMDMREERQIIAGLTQEVLDRLQRTGSLEIRESRALTYTMNTEELKIELDLLVGAEPNITPLLHTAYAAPYLAEDGEIAGVVVASKNGLGVILAERFVDATGDGDLLRDLPCETWMPKNWQPPTPGIKIGGKPPLDEETMRELIYRHADEAGLEQDLGWGSTIPGTRDVAFYAPTHVYGVNCADVWGLTRAEMEARRQIRGIMDLLRQYRADTAPVLLAINAYIGIRETRHVRCEYTLAEADLLGGRRFEDAILNGTYPVDIHSDDDLGILHKYLDGTQHYAVNGQPVEVGTWLEPGQEPPAYYQAPYGVIVPRGSTRVFAAGRMVDADTGAFGALRVMVNLNQLGEAAGVAAFVSLDSGLPIREVSTQTVRRLLKQGGSVV